MIGVTYFPSFVIGYSGKECHLWRTGWMDMHLKNWQCNYLFFSYTIVISLSLELYSHPFWLVCTNDLVKDRCIADNITIHCILLFIILKKRFHVPAYLFWDIDHKDLKMWFKNISYMLGSLLCATFLFLLLYFDVVSDLLLKRCTAIRNLFVGEKTFYWFICQLNGRFGF